jgi:hypothetical protein
MGKLEVREVSIPSNSSAGMPVSLDFWAILAARRSIAISADLAIIEPPSQNFGVNWIVDRI